jgi:hypothetical protein
MPAERQTQLYPCHYCGKPTAMGPFMAEDGDVYHACCADCFDRIDWEAVPASECDAETIRLAEEARRLHRELAAKHHEIWERNRAGSRTS